MTFPSFFREVYVWKILMTQFTFIECMLNESLVFNFSFKGSVEKEVTKSSLVIHKLKFPREDLAYFYNV